MALRWIVGIIKLYPFKLGLILNCWENIGKTLKPKTKKALLVGLSIVYLKTSAQNEGFEPPDLLQSTVFKTAAFDHSANSPLRK